MLQRLTGALMIVALGFLAACSGPSSLEMAEVAYQSGNYDRAIAWSSKSIDEESHPADAYLIRGKSYEKKGNTQKAIADYEVARVESPDRGEPAFRQARCYLASGRTADAENIISKSLKDCYGGYSVRDRMLAHAVHGEIQLAVGDFSHASESFDQALKVAHSSHPLESEGTTSAVYYNQSRALYEQGSFRRARECFQTYLEAQKANGQVPREQDTYTLAVLHFLCEDIASSNALAATLSPESKAKLESMMSGDTFSVRALYDLKQKERAPEPDSNP